MNQIYILLLLGTLACHDFLYGQDVATGKATSTATEALAILPVPRSTLALEAPSVIQHASLAGPQGKPMGIRLYQFTLEPKETLHLEMKAEESALTMSFLTPNPPNAMTPAVRSAMTAPLPLRGSRIKINNPSGEVQEAVLEVRGPLNHAYAIKLKYVPGK